MKFLIKQKIFSFSDEFYIKNECQEDCFRVKGKVLSFGDRLRMYDIDGNELFHIEQRLLRFMPEYIILQKDEVVATVKKEFVFLKPRFRITGKYGDFAVEGNFLAMEYSIYDNEEETARISKRWFSSGDTYGVEIFRKKNWTFFLCLAIVVDQLIHENDAIDGRN